MSKGQAATKTYKIRYLDSVINTTTNDYRFAIRYRFYKQRPTVHNFIFRSKIDKVFITEQEWSFPYALRRTQHQLILSQEIIDNGGTYDFKTFLDTSFFNVGRYYISVDGGQKYNDFVLETNIGHDIDYRDIEVSYNVNIQPYSIYESSPGETLIQEDVDNFNGYYAWENIVPSISHVIGAGDFLIAGNVTTLTGSPIGPKPYSADRVSIDVEIEEGMHIFDVYVQEMTAVLYVIHVPSNRVVRMATASAPGELTRMVVDLPEDSYTLVISTLESATPGGATANAGLFEVTGYGPEFGTTVDIDHRGYSQYGYLNYPGIDEEALTDIETFLPHPCFYYSIGQFCITVKDIDPTSSISLTLLEDEYSLIPAEWTSYVPGEDPIDSYVPTPKHKIKIRRLDPCCFERGLSLDPRDKLCVIPPGNDTQEAVEIFDADEATSNRPSVPAPNECDIVFPPDPIVEPFLISGDVDGNSQFPAYFTSIDEGVNWVESNAPADYDREYAGINSVAASPTSAIMVGRNGYMVRVTAPGEAEQIFGNYFETNQYNISRVLYLNGTYVVFGGFSYFGFDEDIYIYSIDDGITWSTEQYVSGSENYDITDVSIANNKLFAMGENGYLWTTEDGWNWTECTFENPQAYEIRTQGDIYREYIRYSNGIYIISATVGNNVYILSSEDGLLWKEYLVNTLGNAPYVQPSFSDDAKFFVNNYSSGFTPPYTSEYHISDDVHPLVINTGTLIPERAYGGSVNSSGIYVTGGVIGSDETYRSTDGTTWSLAQAVNAGLDVYNIQFNAGEIFVGIGGYNENIMYSTDGTSWIEVVNGVTAGTDNLMSAQRFGDLLVFALGGVIATTRDGISYNLYGNGGLGTEYAYTQQVAMAGAYPT